MRNINFWVFIANFWWFSGLSSQTFPDCVVQTAMTFLDKPYLENPLRYGDNEIVSTSLDSFDCVTLVETTTALALHQNVWNKQKFNDILTQLRYRHGIFDGYISRIHYFTEWLSQAEHSGIGKNISLQIGGETRKKNIHFMSKNSNLYPPLSDTKVLQQMIEIESKLSDIPVPYIPKQKIPLLLDKLQNGDIVAFTSSRAGLDVHHVGFVKIMNRKPHLIHASTLTKKVEISKTHIGEYIKSRKESDGIIIFRFADFEKN